MAWFDVGAGLAEMGKTVAQTTSVAMLEQMKAQNEEARIRLANDLATERESKGRKEAHGYDMEKMDKDQTFKAAEGKADRENRVTTAGIGAGATIQSTRLQIEARKEEAKLDREARVTEREKMIEAQLKSHAAVKVGQNNEALLVNPATGEWKPMVGPDGAPLKLRDTEQFKAIGTAITENGREHERLLSQMKEERQAAQARLKAAQDSIDGKLDGAKNPAVAAAQAELDNIMKRYAPRIAEYERTSRALTRQLMGTVQIEPPNVTPQLPLDKIITGKPGEAR